MRISDWSSDVCSSDLHMRHLHPHRLAGDLHILVAPVELVGLTRLEGHRDERRCAFASILPPRSTPARRIAAHRIIGYIEPLAHQQVMDQIGRAEWRAREGKYG